MFWLLSACFSPTTPYVYFCTVFTHSLVSLEGTMGECYIGTIIIEQQRAWHRYQYLSVSGQGLCSSPHPPSPAHPSLPIPSAFAFNLNVLSITSTYGTWVVYISTKLMRSYTYGLFRWIKTCVMLWFVLRSETSFCFSQRTRHQAERSEGGSGSTPIWSRLSGLDDGQPLHHTPHTPREMSALCINIF